MRHACTRIRESCYPVGMGTPSDDRVIRTKVGTDNDTVPAIGVSKAGETITVPRGNKLHLVAFAYAAGGSIVSDFTYDLRLPRFLTGAQLWTAATNAVRVGIKGSEEVIVENIDGEVWPMLTTIAGTAVASVRIRAWLQPREEL